MDFDTLNSKIERLISPPYNRFICEFVCQKSSTNVIYSMVKFVDDSYIVGAVGLGIFWDIDAAIKNIDELILELEKHGFTCNKTIDMIGFF